MSGYNKKTEIFELTATKAEYWDRKPHDPSIKLVGMNYYAKVLRKNGLEVQNRGSFLKIKGTPDRIWEILSGQPSNSERTEHYY